LHLAHELRFPIGRIQERLSLSSADETSCQVASGIAVGHLADIRQKTSNLQALEATLEDLLKACAERAEPACLNYRNPV
jgi:DNA-binding transcriptional MerR regulator